MRKTRRERDEDICDQLRDEGMIIVGPAQTLGQGVHLAAAGDFEMALLDANLNGDRVDEIAASLAAQGIPFAFCTGYGREALPRHHERSPVLAKPFGRDELLEVLNQLDGRGGAV